MRIAKNFPRHILTVLIMLLAFVLTACPNGGNSGTTEKSPIEQTEPPPGQDFNPSNVTPEFLNFNVDNIVVDGDYGYATARFNGLYILDMKNPKEPKPVKHVDTPGFGVNLAVSNGYAYIADGEEGIQVIDVDPVDEASIIGSAKTPTPAKDVAISGKFAYIACGGGWEDKNGTIEIVDMSDKKSPVTVVSVPTGGEARCLEIKDGYAYVCDGKYGFFKIIDVDPPESAKIVGTVEIVEPKEVALSGNLACVTTGDGVKIIDITTPESPAEIRFIDMPNWASGVAISGDYAFVADSKDGIYPVKIVRPELGRIGDPAKLACGASAISIFENFIFVPNSIRPPTMNLTWIQDGNSGFTIVDIKSPLSPSVVGSMNVLGNCKKVAVYGKNAYTVNSAVFNVVDIDPPEKAKLAGSYNFPIPQVNERQPQIYRPMITDVEADGRYAYVADDNSGIMIIDVIHPKEPKLVKTVDTPGQIKTGEFGYYQVDSTKRKAQRMKVLDGNAYLIVNDRTLAIADLDPPESSEVIGTLELPGESNDPRNFNAGMPAPDLFVDGTKAYVTEYVYGDRRLIEGEGPSGNTRITAIDIADPKSPSIVEKIDLPNVGNVLAISQGHVYLSHQESDSGSSPVSESLRSTGYLWGEEKSVFMLEIYDLNGSDKTKPIGSVETEGVISPARIVGPYLYADIYGKMSIIRIDPPEHPEIVKAFEPQVIANDFDVYNGYLYFADDRTGLSIFKLW